MPDDMIDLPGVELAPDGQSWRLSDASRLPEALQPKIAALGLEPGIWHPTPPAADAAFDHWKRWTTSLSSDAGRDAFLALEIIKAYANAKFGIENVLWRDFLMTNKIALNMVLENEWRRMQFVLKSD